MRCASCAIDITNASCTGESGLYNPGPNSFLLCEPCFLDEDDAIDTNGTNDNPDLLAVYARNQPEGMN